MKKRRENNDLLMTIECSSPNAALLVSNNLFSPARQNTKKHAKKVNEKETATSSLLRNRTVNDAADMIVRKHKDQFDKEDKVAFSVSIDATKIVPMVQLNTRHKAIVGGATPNDVIDIPNEVVDADDGTMERFITA